MTTVTVVLSAPWPTALGLRRPQEGPFPIDKDEADRIVEAGAGEILAEGEAVPAATPAQRPTRRARSTPAPSPAAAPSEDSEAE